MNHDVAIVGAGIVGLSLACALGQEGLRVALIESAPQPAPPPLGEDERRPMEVRVSAITHASEALLTGLGVWSNVAAARQCSFEAMQVWNEAGGGSIGFSCADLGLNRLGSIVENRALLNALEQRAQALESVRWYRPARLSGLEVMPDGAWVRLDAGRLRSSLVVGADGAHSNVRALAGLSVRGGEFPQRAVVANFATASGHQYTAWQRFMRAGPLALLPLPEGAVSIVWSTSEDHAQHLTSLGPMQLASEVETACEGRLWGLEALDSGPAKSFPLAYHHARSYVADRVALVGDAAHAIHPLAGQGVNLGLLDAASLAQILTKLRDRGRDMGRLANLKRYERWRYGHNLMMGETMRAFHHVFTHPFAPVRWLGGVGFSLTGQLAPAKRAFVRQAAGLYGDLPALVHRGLYQMADDDVRSAL